MTGEIRKEDEAKILGPVAQDIGVSERRARHAAREWSYVPCSKSVNTPHSLFDYASLLLRVLRGGSRLGDGFSAGPRRDTLVPRVNWVGPAKGQVRADKVRVCVLIDVRCHVFLEAAE